jgi:hypothetical protein
VKLTIEIRGGKAVYLINTSFKEIDLFLDIISPSIFRREFIELSFVLTREIWKFWIWQEILILLDLTSFMDDLFNF